MIYRIEKVEIIGTNKKTILRPNMKVANIEAYRKEIGQTHRGGGRILLSYTEIIK